jgi:thiamine-phosphate pyrophosphorylase
VGQDDLPVGIVRGLRSDAIVGVSTHDRSQVDAALATSAGYVAVGPVFGTSTKETSTSLGAGSRALRRGSGKPIVAIGGITLDQAPDVMAAGASAVAVISDLLTGDDPEARARSSPRCQPGRSMYNAAFSALPESARRR